MQYFDTDFANRSTVTFSDRKVKNNGFKYKGNKGLSVFINMFFQT